MDQIVVQALPAVGGHSWMLERQPVAEHRKRDTGVGSALTVAQDERTPGQGVEQEVAMTRRAKMPQQARRRGKPAGQPRHAADFNLSS